MSAALIDLVSKGVQDVYITGQPEVSFFRQNYKRHTNFALKPERLDYIGTFGSNNEVSIPIPNKGDLLGYVWIEAPGIARNGTNTTGFFSEDVASLTEFSLWIGGQQVVTLDGLFIQGVHNLLYNADSSRAACAPLTNYFPAQAQGVASGSADHYVIPFFFSEDLTKVLPLIGIKFHEVEIRVKCRAGFVPANSPKVFATYFYVDTDERSYFMERDHELLIQQVQYQMAAPGETEFDLTYFNHPCKAVHLVSSSANGSAWNDEYTFDRSSLYINGTTLFENMSNVFHHTVVPQMHTTVLPLGLQYQPTYTWPFCLSLNKQQPTGSLNFSRIDNAKLVVSSPNGGGNIVRVYAVNYNVLRIKRGMAGIAYSN
ncbi:hypothetical protein [Dishui Lake phycodnavirus 4]|nr:hypothetical protein [Dishui Lake phycodnavirus 4]